MCTHSICVRFHTDPATNSKTRRIVTVKYAMVRVQYQRLRERVATFSSVTCWNVLVV